MPKTLLLADDSVTIQKVVGISFASEDIQITTVDNGRDAVAKARTLRPDIILADVVMPGMSGYEVCEAIKADPNLRHVPVLLLTGTFESFDEARAAAVGAAGHVAKPFEAQTLVDRVKQLLAAATAPRAPVAPRAASARPAPAPPRADDQAFDFFSDAPDEVATAAPAMPPDALDLDEPDAAFAFGDDDLAAHVQEPLPAPPLGAARRRPDATVAILPDPPASEPADEDAFDFSFERNSADALDEPVDPDQLGHTTLLDPAAASGFDVSSSDLAAPLSNDPADKTQILSAPFDRAIEADFDLTEPEPFDEPVARMPRDLILDRLTRAPIQREPLVIGEPIAVADLEDRMPPYGAEPDPGDTIPRGSAAVELATPLWSEDAAAPIDEPFEAPRFDSDDIAQPIDDAPLAEPIRPALGGPALSPALRGELHDTLEKIAWDAFGQVTEKIVRDAIARIEQVAWEIVPKLAETLIQEEIRRLKAGAGE